MQFDQQNFNDPVPKINVKLGIKMTSLPEGSLIRTKFRSRLTNCAGQLVLAL
jgi:hypothetical protein